MTPANSYRCKSRQFLAGYRNVAYHYSEDRNEATMTGPADTKTAKIEKTGQIEPETPKRKRATKRELAKRDVRLVEQLAAGATIEEIAANQGISVKWARERKAAVLGQRAIDPPHEFIKLQVRRLSEAMLVAYSAVSDGNLKAIDQVIKVVRELDRYHGFGPDAPFHGLAAPAPAEFPPPPPLALPQPPAALAPPDGEETAEGEESEPLGQPK
jgi:hypothetical protein